MHYYFPEEKYFKSEDCAITGSDSREAASLGILMKIRGLMDLVVLNVVLGLGVLSPTLFAMYVLMAAVTTLATTPTLQA